LAGFKFRLQSFLDVKEKIEEQKKLEYGKALNKVDEEKKIKLKFEMQKNNIINDFRNDINLGINPRQLQSYNLYIEVLKKKIRDQNILIDIAEKNAEKKRLELVEAVKERKMLETLKEKDNIEYMKEQNRAEQRIVDEIVSYQYNNKK